MLLSCYPLRYCCYGGKAFGYHHGELIIGPRNSEFPPAPNPSNVSVIRSFRPMRAWRKIFCGCHDHKGRPLASATEWKPSLQCQVMILDEETENVEKIDDIDPLLFRNISPTQACWMRMDEKKEQDVLESQTYAVRVNNAEVATCHSQKSLVENVLLVPSLRH